MTATKDELDFGAPAQWQQGAMMYEGGPAAKAVARSRRIDQDLLADAGKAAEKARSAAFARWDYPEGLIGLYVPRRCSECGSLAPDTRMHDHPYNTASSND